MSMREIVERMIQRTPNAASWVEEDRRYCDRYREIRHHIAAGRCTMNETTTVPMIDKCPKCKATGFGDENRERWACACGATWRRCWVCLRAVLIGLRCRCEDNQK
jgi:acyl-CoA reductase-like NAD-dependent aldehyde dehydrogenase